MDLQARWFHSYSDKPNSTLIWEWLHSAHSEPHRVYHTLNHLAQCFSVLDQIPDLPVVDKAVVELAIWFHDSVYQTDSSFLLNEIESHKLFVNAAKLLNLPSETFNLVNNLFLDSIFLSCSQELARKFYCSKLCNLFLDIDLSILGQEKLVYDKYAAAVRQEFPHVPTKEYVLTRKSILENFYSRAPLYHHPVLFEKYEKVAKENLSREIANLSDNLYAN